MNFLLNELVDIMEKEARAAKSDPETSSPSERLMNGPKNAQQNGVSKEPLVTWVHKNFQVIYSEDVLAFNFLFSYLHIIVFMSILSA